MNFEHWTHRKIQTAIKTGQNGRPSLPAGQFSSFFITDSLDQSICAVFELPFYCAIFYVCRSSNSEAGSFLTSGKDGLPARPVQRVFRQLVAGRINWIFQQGLQKDFFILMNNWVIFYQNLSSKKETLNAVLSTLLIL